MLGSQDLQTSLDGLVEFTFNVAGDTVGALTATATPLDPAAGRSTSEFSACLVVGGEPGEVTLDAVQASVPSTGVVPLANVEGSAFIPETSAATESAPITNIPIKNIPIKNIPIKNIPITNIGFADPSILPLLRAFPLSEVPLLRPGGWPAALQGTTYADAPLQSVSLGDALGLPAIAALQLTLDDLELSRTPLGDLPAVATVLGTIPLSSLPLPGGADWCSLVGPGVQCSGSSSVLSISIQGAPITNIPITNIPIKNIPITNIPITNIPIKNIPITNIPIKNIPITNIPITNISGFATLIDCVSHACAGATIYDALVGDWFLPTATLGDLLLALPEPNDVTLADVLILLFSSTSSVGWEQLDLETAGLQAAAGGANAIDWHADVEITSAAIAATVTLPKGSVFDTSFEPTVQTLPAGPPAPLPSPEIGTDADGNVALEWSVSGTIGTTRRISFRTFPPFRVGPQAGTLEATAGSELGTTSDPAPVTVTETFEPNGEGSPQPVSPDSLYLSYVTQSDDLDFYSLPAPPAGSTIRVFLSHLPADYDLALYSPTDTALRPAVAGTELLDSPPLVDTGVPLGTEQAALPPETLDDLRIDPNRPLVGVSANRGTEDDSIVAISGGGTGSYLIQVTPYNGATSDEPYMLRVEVEAPRVPLTAAPLAPASGTPGTVPASLAAGTNTLFLWNRSQLSTLYGAASATSVLTAMQATQGELASLGFPSAIVGVDGNAAVAGAMAAWNADPGDPAKANAVVRAVNAVVDGFRASPNGTGIKYLVLVGGDRAMPFARLEDYVTISNESDYAQSVGSGNELSAALGAGQMLSDDAYADTSPVPYLNRQLFVPDLSVGRLVETPAEIVAALARYRDFNGVLDPTTARVAGYDFLADGAEAVRQALNARPGLNAPAEPTLIGDAWSRDDLIGALLPTSGQPPNIASLNGHADHFRLAPPSAVGSAPAVPFTTSDLVADTAATLSNGLVFSMGCHAGLSVADALIGQGLDWPQAYLREGATYLGNTTFGYGDTAVVAYSEELNRLLAEQVASGGPIGDALRFAKNEYFSTRGVFGVYDEKAMAAFTLYGLPMWSVGAVPQAQSLGEAGLHTLARTARSASAAAAAPLAIPTTTVGNDPVTGLEVEQFDASPAFASVSTAGGTFLRGDSGVQVSHLRPVQPKLVIELGGTQAHGALVTGLTSSDQAGVNPVYARPIVDQSATEPELSFNDVAYPSKLLTVRTFVTGAGDRQRLVVGTGQFFGNATSVDANGTGIQRRYTRVAGQVYRSSSNDRVAPTFTKIDAFLVSGNAAFSVDVAGGDAKRVVASYRSGTTSVWQFVDLAEGPAGHWSGGGPVAASQFEYFLQVVDEAGIVGVSTNKGFYFDGAALPPDTTPDGPLELEPPAPNGDNGWFTGAVVVSVAGPEGVPVQVSVDGGPYQDPGADNAVTVSGDGVHVLSARAATGETDTVLVPIDGTPPEIAFGTPAAGATYQPGASLPAAYECVDRGSGATSCAGTVAVGTPISTTLGPKTFTVTTRDRAGNETSRTINYTVAYRKILFSSTRSGFGDIYAINSDGTGLTRLTNEVAPDEEPAWSPDGSQIAFASRRSGLDQDIFVMNADGSNVRQLTTARGDDTAPAWAPDGSRIVFRSSRDGNFEIYAMNADGSDQTRLTDNRKEDLSPTWSPDGSKIAWSRGNFAKADVYVMDADGSHSARIARDASDPDWGVHGKIVFTRSLVGPFVWEIYSMNANGSGMTRLTSVRGRDFDPAWSSDGQKIVFSSGRNHPVNLELYLMNGDGSGQTRVTASPGLDRTPDW
jgi:Tol biopolymer transport system component